MISTRELSVTWERPVVTARVRAMRSSKNHTLTVTVTTSDLLGAGEQATGRAPPIRDRARLRTDRQTMGTQRRLKGTGLTARASTGQR